MPDIDFITPPWWVTVSGAGTPSAELESWADDYTRHRSGISNTYTSVDSIIGRSDKSYKYITISGADTFTDYTYIGPEGATVLIEDIDSMSLTVSLQVMPEGTTSWIDTGDTWTAGGMHAINGISGFKSRLGVKSGDYASGTAKVYLYRR